jgi:hypothetical protein
MGWSNRTRNGRAELEPAVGRAFRLAPTARLWTEFEEDGVLRGAGLIDPQGRISIALRDRSVCAGQPDLRGFDVVAFVPRSHAVLDQLAAHCDRLCIVHSGVGHNAGGSWLDVPDPDGTVLRFYDYTASTEGFTGIESRTGEPTAFYDTPRLARLSKPPWPRCVPCGGRRSQVDASR